MRPEADKPAPNTLITKTDHKFTFGKHKGLTIEEVLRDDPGYIRWAQKNVKGFQVSKTIMDTAIKRNTVKQADYYTNNDAGMFDMGYMEY